MYPVQGDYIAPNPNVPGGKILTTRGHEIHVGPNGSIRIIIRPDKPNGGTVILEKPGTG